VDNHVGRLRIGPSITVHRCGVPGHRVQTCVECYVLGVGLWTGYQQVINSRSGTGRSL